MINASINHSKYRMSHISSGKRMEIGKKVVNLWETIRHVYEQKDNGWARETNP